MTIPVRVSDKDLLDLFELVTAHRDEDPGDGLPLSMRQAGFTGVEVRWHELPVSFEGGPAHLLRTLAATAVASDVAALDEAGRRALAAAIEKTAAPLVKDGAVRSEAAARLVIATAGVR